MTSNQYYANKRPEILQFTPNSYINVLEIGCGNGEFFKNIAPTLQGTSYGVEPNKRAVLTAKLHFDHIISGTYEEVSEKIPNNFFDLVICNDVIEHMTDHNFFMNSIQRKMIHKGYMIGSVPNFRYINNLKELILKKDFKYKKSGILDETHLRFFTEKSLNDVFLTHNLLINKINGINKTTYSKTTNSLFKKIATKALGNDTEYFQIGFRVQKK